MISSLLHVVGLRLRVYYTLTNFKGGGGGGGGKAPIPPPQYANGTDLCIYPLKEFILIITKLEGPECM